ncbi:MAG: hypothetical protein Q9166_003362 [cf. Caloplaca sp. 2 TL-2023]
MFSSTSESLAPQTSSLNNGQGTQANETNKNHERERERESVEQHNSDSELIEDYFSCDGGYFSCEEGCNKRAEEEDGRKPSTEDVKK